MNNKIKHWDGTSSYVKGYQHGLFYTSQLFPDIYNDTEKYSLSFIKGYNAGKKRAKLHHLVTGEHYGRANKV